MCPILPWLGAGALTHCDGSLPTPHTMYACVKVFGLLAPWRTFNVEGRGWVILEWSDEVRLGMIRLWSPLSLVGGRSRSLVRGRRLSEGAIVGELQLVPIRWDRPDGDWCITGTPKGLGGLL
jgi:hypothetical protein